MLLVYLPTKRVNLFAHYVLNYQLFKLLYNIVKVV